MFDLDSIIRENIKSLTPYSSARDEFKGVASIFLDANENSLGSVLNDYNRYPDPLQWKVKDAIAEVKQINRSNIFLGNGSDECIDLLYRCCCEPGKDNVIICPPTYGMYEVSANINAVEIRNVPLTSSFELNEEAIINSIDSNTKLIWICSPNNPTGSLADRKAIVKLLNSFNGLVVVDEAYADFSSTASFINDLSKKPNLVVLQTFSKAWGLAGLRLGMAFASAEIINILNKVKPPYNINQASQEMLLKALQHSNGMKKKIDIIIAERQKLITQLSTFNFVQQVYSSEANFLLVKTDDAGGLYKFLLQNEIVVRDRSKVLHCEGCLRITVGAPEENQKLINTLHQFEKETA
jgi:histidinol-phosphate aminotransferase